MAAPKFNQGLQQNLKQEMRLLPRMLQSIEVLQLSLGELDSFLQEASLSNEALQLEPSSPRSEEAGPPRSAGGEATERHAAFLESQPEREPGLVAILEAQLSMLELEPLQLRWVHFVIGCVDTRGYLSVPDEALLALARGAGLEPDEAQLGRAIGVLQGLEPRGIGGRDVVESLLLQLDPSDGDYSLLCRLLEEFLDELARNKLPQVARGLGIELDQLSALSARLRELNPAPGFGLVDGFAPPLRPDVIVELKQVKGSDRTTFQIRMDRSGIPPVTLDPEVERLAHDPGQEPGVRRYLKDKVEKAGWIVDALEQREQTLMRVATWIFEHQLEFLRRGPKSIVPITMTDAAEELGMHISTVSRAVAGKYADTPWGIVALRSLFPAAAAGQPSVARGSVQESLRKIVDSEDSKAPHSDDELCERLAAVGFKLARRTVAKYRRELEIPSSYRRRSY